MTGRETREPTAAASIPTRPSHAAGPNQTIVKRHTATQHTSHNQRRWHTTHSCGMNGQRGPQAGLQMLTGSSLTLPQASVLRTAACRPPLQARAAPPWLPPPPLLAAAVPLQTGPRATAVLADGCLADPPASQRLHGGMNEHISFGGWWLASAVPAGLGGEHSWELAAGG